MELRRITPEDAQAAHAVTMAGFRTYPAFAPEGLQTPEDIGAEGATKRIPRNGSLWGCRRRRRRHRRLRRIRTGAGGDGLRVSLVRSYPGSRTCGPSSSRSRIGVAVWRLELLADLTDHIRTAGFVDARLYVAAGQTRARAFYAREGWRDATEPFMVEKLGLELVEMRRSFLAPEPPCGRSRRRSVRRDGWSTRQRRRERPA